MHNGDEKQFLLIFEKLQHDLSLLNKQPLENDKQKLDIIVGILDAIAYVHKRRYAFQSLLPNRIWFDTANSVKIIPLDMSKHNFSVERQANVFATSCLLYQVWFGEEYSKKTKILGASPDSKLEQVTASIRNGIKPGLNDDATARPFIDMTWHYWHELQQVLGDMMEL